MTTEHSAAEQPARIGRYRITGALGEGGMGAVLAGHDDALDRAVAIKTVLPPPGAPKDVVQIFFDRFAQEGRALAALTHPNVVHVYDVGTDGDAPYLVMERLPGPSLSERIEIHKRLDPDEVRRIGIQMASALEAMHARGIVHRDLKPSNVVAAADGWWKLVDFGIAHLPRSTLTVVGQFLGTPAYAAPESFERGEFGPASDVYALGATLYAALAGEPPHGTRGLMTMVTQPQRPAPRLRDRRNDVAADLDGAIVAALAPDPKARPTAAQLGRALAGEAPSDGIRAPVATPTRPTAPIAVAGAARAGAPPWLPWAIVGAGVSMLGIAVLVVLLAAWAWNRDESDPEPGEATAPGQLERREAVGGQERAGEGEGEGQGERAGEGEPLIVTNRDPSQMAQWRQVQRALDHGDGDKAMERLEKILERDPTDEQARELYERLRMQMEAEEP